MGKHEDDSSDKPKKDSVKMKSKKSKDKNDETTSKKKSQSSALKKEKKAVDESAKKRKEKEEVREETAKKHRKRTRELSSDDSETGEIENCPKRIQKSNHAKSEDNKSAENSSTRIAAKAKDENDEPEDVKLDPGSDPNHPGHFSHFSLSAETEKNLRNRKISHLFPIQISTFRPIIDGKDVIGRAKTGTGKTLAFALPIIEKLKRDGALNGVKPRGRAPQVIVMAPTRELAKQVCADFEMIAPELSSTCVYGGVPYDPQINAFRHGVDVLVGTPGRILDHLERGTLRLNDIRFVVMDEADQMLDIGFADAMESLLKSVNEQLRNSQVKNYQVLLFSATLPPWIFDVSKKYMNPERVLIDLIGSQKMKASETVAHYIIPCHWQQRHAVLADIVQVYGGGKNGRTIVFAETKSEANEIAMGNEGSQGKLRCQVLHGDIPQKQREITLHGFREGKFNCLVATDVAARGIDIAEVDLVVQCQPPKDAETYIHRAGRTGRAGKSGSCILFYKPNEEYQVRNIEKRVGVIFKKLTAPQPKDIVAAAAADAIQLLVQVPKNALPPFLPIVQELLKDHLPEEALAAALALITGNAKGIAQRSLLCSQDGFTTMLLNSEQEIRTHSYVWNLIRKDFPMLCIDDTQTHVRGLKLFRDSRGAAFDIPSDKVDIVLGMWKDKARFWHGLEMQVATVLPSLQEPAASGTGHFSAQNRFSNNNSQRRGSFRGNGRFGSGASRGGRGQFRR